MAASFDLLGGRLQKKSGYDCQKLDDLGKTSPKTLAMFGRLTEFLGEFKEHYS